MNRNESSGQLRILSIIPYKVLPARLGGEKGIALFNKYLGQKSKLTSLATRSNDPAEAEHYTVLNTISDSRIRYINLLLFFRVRRMLKKSSSSHLLIEHPYFGWLAFLIKRTTSVTWVVHSHNIEYMRSKSIGRSWWKLLRAYERWVYRHADINFFISEDDMQHAITHLGVDPQRSIAITYGVEQPGVPNDRQASRQLIGEKHGIDSSQRIFLFNGALYHHTNYDAVTAIAQHINPLLKKALGNTYKILVCGKGLPDSFNELKQFADENIVYAGFVDDISVYFKATDVFLNPIMSGGGVKTKAIEALSYNCSVVSTTIGAMGLKQDVCGEKLSVVPDGDWERFSSEVVRIDQFRSSIPQPFYEYYYWGNIADRIVDRLRKGV